MSPRRLLGCGGFVFLVLAIGGCKKTSAPPSEEEDVLLRGRVLSAKLPQTVVVEPYGLEARVPAEWICTRENSRPTTCRIGTTNASWTLRAGAAPRYEATIGTTLYARESVAGFDGTLYGHAGVKGPEEWVAFAGEKDVPGHGKLALAVKVGDDLQIDRATWLAVVLTTRIGPNGIAASWPTDAEMETQGRIAGLKATLARDDERPENWVGAARELAKIGLDDGGENLITGRIQEIALAEPGALLLAGGKGTRFVHGAQLAKTLRGRSDQRCDAALDVLETALVTAHERERDVARPARALATARGMLAIADGRREEARPTTWARMRTLLAKTEPEIFTSYSGPEILSSSVATDDPKMIAWAAEKIATAKIDGTFDHGRIAEILTDRRVLVAPGAKRRLATLLADKATHGTSSTRDRGGTRCLDRGLARRRSLTGPPSKFWGTLRRDGGRGRQAGTQTG